MKSLYKVNNFRRLKVYTKEDMLLNKLDENTKKYFQTVLLFRQYFIQKT